MTGNLTEKRNEVNLALELIELKAIMNTILQTQARILAHLENKSDDRELIQELYYDVARNKQLITHNLFGSK